MPTVIQNPTDICVQYQPDKDWLEQHRKIIRESEILPGIYAIGEKIEMEFVLDCEFNGFEGQLISIALVPVDKSLETFYRELFLQEEITDWVLANVIYKLDQFQKGCAFKSPNTTHQLQSDLAFYLSQFDKVHIVADWPDDIKYFCQLLITGPGTRIDTPPLTMEIRRDLDCDSEVPHHALHDAIAIRNKYLEVKDKK